MSNLLPREKTEDMEEQLYFAVSILFGISALVIAGVMLLLIILISQS